MKKKCLTAKVSVFVQNETRPDIYDVHPLSGSNLPFSYFRLSLPYSPILINQGAVYVAESHKNNVKVLYTGLRRSKVNNLYVGDVFDMNKKTRSLILFQFNPTENSYKVYLFDGKYPRNINPIINEIAGL